MKKSVRNKPNVRRLVKNEITRTLEEKYFISTLASTASLAGGVIFPVTQLIIEGDEVNQRTGRQITLTGVRFSLNASLPALGLAGSLRVLLFSDTMNLGTGILTTDVINAATITAPVLATGYQEKRFKFHLDHVFSMVVGGADQQVHLLLDRKLSHKVTYNNSGNTTNANSRNAMYLLFLTDLAANTPNYSYDIVVKFHDG